MTIAIGLMLIVIQICMFAYLIEAEKEISRKLSRITWMFEPLEDGVEERYIDDTEVQDHNRKNSDA